MKTNSVTEKIRIWLSKDHRAAWTVFALFAFFTFVKTLLFDQCAFAYRMTGTLFASQRAFWGALLIKLSLAIIFASFVFLLRDKRWIILLSFVIDTWCVANLVYMRNNYILLDAEAFNEAGNLHGYWTSTLIYIEWGIDLVFYLMTALMSCIFFFTNRSPRSWRYFLIVFAAGIVFHFAGDAVQQTMQVNTISREGREQIYGTSYTRAVEHNSILEAPAYVLYDYSKMKKNDMPVRPLTEEDLALLEPLTNGTPLVQSNEPLLIILLESLENWVVREDVMPNLWKLSQSEHVLYADHIHTQIVGAPSADGQMIVNTGLLPISAGATCLHFPHNYYPSLMKLTDEHTTLLLPHDPSVWNQTEMSPAYGYDTTIVFSDIDTLLFRRLNQLIDDGERHIQCITQSTHAPFANEKYSSLEVPQDMPWVMSNYIRGFNALDDGLNLFIDKLLSDESLQQYTIVITGDHRILHKEKRDQMMRYGKKHDMDYNAKDDCLPLIIYSPKIEGNKHITAESYQMDIYPTVLHLLGAEDYMWKGLGVNLLDENALLNRPVSPQRAAEVSDRMLRNDYFRKYVLWESAEE